MKAERPRLGLFLSFPMMQSVVVLKLTCNRIEFEYAKSGFEKRGEEERRRGGLGGRMCGGSGGEAGQEGGS